MTVRAEQSGSPVVIHLQGRLSVESEPRQLLDLVLSNAQVGPGAVVLDLKQLAQLDCTGIGRLVELRRRIAASGGTLALVNLAPRHRRLLELAGLLGVFRVPDVQRPMTGWDEPLGEIHRMAAVAPAC